MSGAAAPACVMASAARPADPSRRRRPLAAAAAAATILVLLALVVIIAREQLASARVPHSFAAADGGPASERAALESQLRSDPHGFLDEVRGPVGQPYRLSHDSHGLLQGFAHGIAV